METNVMETGLVKQGITTLAVGINTDMVVSIGVSHMEESYHTEIATCESKRGALMPKLKAANEKLNSLIGAMAKDIGKTEQAALTAFAESRGLKVKAEVSIVDAMFKTAEPKGQVSITLKAKDDNTSSRYGDSFSYSVPVVATAAITERVGVIDGINGKLKQLSEVEGACRRGLADLSRHERQVRNAIATKSLTATEEAKGIYDCILASVSTRKMPTSADITVD